MGELKQHQPPMTINEQVENLKEKGLIVEDEEYAKRILNDISYFRLVKAYSPNLKLRNSLYNEGITFEQIVELYLFNANFRENYEGGNLPVYALMEVFSFGTLSKFYKNMLNPDKKAVAATFGVGYTYLESWLESISYVRNICAHYGRLYNAKLSKTPMLYKEYTKIGISNSRIFSVLLCMRHLLKGDAHWNLFADKLEMLFEKYENVDIRTMGFPENWKKLLETDTLKNC